MKKMGNLKGEEKGYDSNMGTNLSNTTKLAFLNSLFLEVAVGGIRIATKPTLLDSLLQSVSAGAMYVCISLKLWAPETSFGGFETC